MKNHYFFAPMIGVDETRGNVQFCFLAKNQDAEQVDADLLSAKLQAFAFIGAADSPAEKGTARFVDGSIQAKSDRVAFSMRVHDDATMKLLKRGVLQGALVRAHTRPSGELTIDGIDFRDNSELRLEKYTHLGADEGYSFAKNALGARRVGIPGMSSVTNPGAHLLDLIKSLRKSSTNADHLRAAQTHLGKVGDHLTAAKARYPFDNNVRGAAISHEAAMESLKKIDLPPELEQALGKPEAVAPARDVPTFAGPVGRFGVGPMNHDGSSPRVTATQPDRKAADFDPNDRDAFKKAFGRVFKRRRVISFRL